MERELCFGDVRLHLLYRVVFVGIDRNEGMRSKLGVEALQAHRVAFCDGTFGRKEREDDGSLFREDVQVVRLTVECGKTHGRKFCADRNAVLVEGCLLDDAVFVCNCVFGRCVDVLRTRARV